MKSILNRWIVWYLQHSKLIYIILILSVLFLGLLELLVCPIDGSVPDYFYSYWLEPYIVLRFVFYIFVYVYWKASKKYSPTYILFPSIFTATFYPYVLVSFFNHRNPSAHAYIFVLLAVNRLIYKHNKEIADQCLKKNESGQMQAWFVPSGSEGGEDTGTENRTRDSQRDGSGPLKK